MPDASAEDVSLGFCIPSDHLFLSDGSCRGAATLSTDFHHAPLDIPIGLKARGRARFSFTHRRTITCLASADTEIHSSERRLVCPARSPCVTRRYCHHHDWPSRSGSKCLTIDSGMSTGSTCVGLGTWRLYLAVKIRKRTCCNGEEDSRASNQATRDVALITHTRMEILTRSPTSRTNTTS